MVSRAIAGIRVTPLVVLALLAGARPGDVSGQEIRFDPRADLPEERQFDAFLDRRGYVVLETDTILGPESVITGDLLILEAEVRLSGTVHGDVAVIGGDLFLRPGARVDGDLLALGGGFYSSQRATVTGEVAWHPNDVYLVERGDDVIRIHHVRDVPEALTLHGLSGILFPTYQRVDEWTLGLGATGRLVEWGWQPSLSVEVRLKTEHGDFEGTVRQAWYPTSALEFGIEAERATRTNEDWVRGDIANSLSFFFAGDDFRNYYEADRVALFLRGSETARWAPILEVQWEDARSLVASDQFVLLASDEAIPNPAIDEGETVSLRAGLEYRLNTTRTSLRTSGTVEVADSDVAGDFDFVLGEFVADWRGPGLVGHGLEAFALVRHDLSGTLPGQRWTAVGGPATLPRTPLLSERGGRFVYGQLTYLVPVDALRLGLLGPPRLFVRGVSAAAWNEGEPASFETNLVAGVRLFVFELGTAFDVRDGFDAGVYATLRFPGDL